MHIILLKIKWKNYFFIKAVENIFRNIAKIEICKTISHYTFLPERHIKNF